MESLNFQVNKGKGNNSGTPSANETPSKKGMFARYVLDTYALLAVLEDEPGAETVTKMFTVPNSKLFLSLINLGEAYYVITRRKGKEAADELVNSVFAEEALTLVDVSWPKIKNAAQIKSRGGLSYADSFVVALAKEIEAPIVTGDPEIKKVADQLGIELIWIRENENI